MIISTPLRAAVLPAATLLITGACARDIVAPTALPVASASGAGWARGPADGFPIVIVREGATQSTEAGAPVVDNLADAVARVAPRGTIRVHAGTYDVANVLIAKPLTIEPAGTGAPVVRTGMTNGFRISGISQGTVTIRGLAFEVHGLRAILAHAQYDQVVVERSRFRSTAGGPTQFGLPIGFVSVGAAANQSPTANFIARNNVFEGGHWALIATGARGEFVNNVVTDMGTGGIQLENNSSGIIAGNTLERCGIRRCIGVATSGPATVSGNTVRNEHPRRVRSAIQAFAGGTVTISDNEVVGTGGEGRATADHAFEFGIDASGGGPRAMHVTIAGNRVGGASQGVSLGGVSTALVEHNTVNPCGAWSCITVFGNDVAANVQVRGNTLRSVLARRTFFALQSGWMAGSGTLAFTDNDIAGATPPADRNAPMTYALDIAFQSGTWWPPGAEGISRGAPVEFSRNRIRDAAVGVRAFHGGVIVGRDNVFTSIFGEALGAHDRGVNRLRFNDIVGYVSPFGLSGSPVADEPHRGTLDVTCNYWGGGPPVNTHSSIPASAYTPYATAPIAGTGATSCN